MDIQTFEKNRRRFPEDDLEKYAGRYVAWSPDGKQIIASADRLADLAPLVRASEFDARNCVLSYVPRSDEIILGEAPGG